MVKPIDPARAAHYRALGRMESRIKRHTESGERKARKKTEEWEASNAVRIARTEELFRVAKKRIYEINRNPSKAGAAILAKIARNKDFPEEIRADASATLLRWADGDFNYGKRLKRRARDPAKSELGRRRARKSRARALPDEPEGGSANRGSDGEA